MTKKEKLYKEYLELSNEIYYLTGETHKVIDLDKCINSVKFKQQAAANKVTYLEDNIAILKNRIKRERFYSTEEGKTYKKVITSELERIQNEIDSTLSEAKTAIQTVSDLGDEWKVENMNEYQLRFTFTGGSRSYHFALYYHFIGDETKYLRMNFPTYGAFDLFTDNVIARYLSGMGKFAANTELLKEIEGILKNYVSKTEELNECYRVTKTKLISVPDSYDF